MGSPADERSKTPTRRAFLAGSSAVFGAALAGCSTSEPDDGDELRARVHELETRVEALESDLEEERTRTRELQAEVAALERERDEYERRLDTWNVWGFSDAELETLQQRAKESMDSIVTIDVITDDGLWSVGSGWVFDERVIATNAHVVSPRRLPDDHGVERYTVWTHEGSEHDAQLLGHTFGEDRLFETREDVAFLRVPRAVSRNRAMNRGVSRELEPDEPLLQIGHPWSLDFWTASVGPFVSHREPFFVSNVPGQPGVSGSPVIDLDGDVVGMTWGGNYHMAPNRRVDEAPSPGDGSIRTTFEESVHGIHSYVHRIETAYDALV